MERTLYLIRHGAVEGPRVCLGRTDLPLSRQGRFQAGLLKLWFENRQPVTALCSPLRRCVETASVAFGSAKPMNGFAEIDMGEWDGLPFETIRTCWPELYRRRGEDMLHVFPPDGEAPENALARFEKTLSDCLKNTEGDIAAVAHSGVMRLMLCKLSGRPLNTAFTLSQPHGCVNVLTLCRDGFHLETEALRPMPVLDERACLSLLKACGCDAELIAHCRAVAGQAAMLTGQLKAAGLALNGEAIQAAALLHDMARGLPSHAAEAGHWLSEAGYRALGKIVARHHDWDGGVIDEAAVVYLADKLVQGDRTVTLKERFTASGEKCKTPEARVAHERRFRTARALLEQVEALCAEKGRH